MTWTRMDDDWTDMPVLADLTYEDRWHYLAMIQFCSRTQKYDGILRIADARRCSDHPDPSQALEHLTELGLISPQGGGYKVNSIDDHIPPPSVRAASAQTKVRMQRSRNHKNGVHSECLPQSCPKAPQPMEVPVTHYVTDPVTRNPSTEQHSTATGQNPSLDQAKNRTGEVQQMNPDYCASLGCGKPLTSRQKASGARHCDEHWQFDRRDKAS